MEYRSPDASDRDQIAIIGLSCRMPGADDATRFWKNLAAGVSSVRRLDDAELLAAGVSRRLLSDPAYVRARGTISGVYRFDAPFFRFSPREAALMDPQQRLGLQAAWAAMDDAGYNTETLDVPVGVFAGVAQDSHLLHLYRYEAAASLTDLAFAETGNNRDFLPARIAYAMDLRGPVMGIQTACSSSLVAVASACQSLLTGQCELALAGGVAVLVPSPQGYLFVEGGLWSPDGMCRPFDAGAKGMVPGDGVGFVVLKRLDQALADGDTIRAVIRGFAVNNDGANKVGFNAPSVEALTQVITLAQELAETDPRDITYVETNGTGTPLGDPLEIIAMAGAFADCGEGSGSCAIGTVKPNIGHTGPASGVAALIKATLCLQRRQLPPSLHFERANPQLDFSRTPFRVPRRLEPWETGGSTRLAGVTCFGLGGTNVHVVLEQAPECSGATDTARARTFLLSAKTADGLDRARQELCEHLRGDEHTLDDVAFTLRAGRRHFEHRRAVVATTRSELLQALASPETAAMAGPLADAPQLERGVVVVCTAAPLSRSLWQTLCESTASLWDAWLRNLIAAGVDAAALDGREPADVIANVASDCPRVSVCAELALWQTLVGEGLAPAQWIGVGLGKVTAACLSGELPVEQVGAASEAYHAEAAEAGAPKTGLGQSLQGTEADEQALWVTASGACSTQGLLASVGRSYLCLEEELGAGHAGLQPAYAALWQRGVRLGPFGCPGPLRGRRVPLPSYPFDERLYWLDIETLEQEMAIGAAPAPTKPSQPADAAQGSASAPAPVDVQHTSCPEQRRAQVQQRVRSHIATLLGVPVERVDVQRPLSALGIDSFVGLRLLQTLASGLGCPLEPSILTPTLSAAQLAAAVSDRLAGCPRDHGNAVAAAGSASQTDVAWEVLDPQSDLERFHADLLTLPREEFAFLDAVAAPGREEPATAETLRQRIRAGLVVVRVVTAQSGAFVGSVAVSQAPHLCAATPSGIEVLEGLWETCTAIVPCYRRVVDHTEINHRIWHEEPRLRALVQRPPCYRLSVRRQVWRTQVHVLARTVATSTHEQSQLARALMLGWHDNPQVADVMQRLATSPNLSRRLWHAIRQERYLSRPGEALLQMPQAAASDQLETLQDLVSEAHRPLLVSALEGVRTGGRTFVGFDVRWLEPLFLRSYSFAGP